MSRPFEVGDRVRARARSVVAVGTLGRVTEILISTQDLYFVQFDGEKFWSLMRAVDLERMCDAPAAERAA